MLTNRARRMRTRSRVQSTKTQARVSRVQEPVEVRAAQASDWEPVQAQAQALARKRQRLRQGRQLARFSIRTPAGPW